jgi:C4-dicarboxylate-specific signal transduction histidine kinase
MRFSVPDILITAIQMSEMTGIELIQRTVQEYDESRPSILCLVETGDVEMSGMYSKGVDAFFRKSVRSDLLIEAACHHGQKRRQNHKTLEAMRSLRQQVKQLQLSDCPTEKNSLAMIVDEALAIARPCMDQHRITLNIHGVSLPEAFSIYPASITQVLVNLLYNAVAAVSRLDERWIHTEIETNKNCLKISVTDSGRGISGATAACIFEPFFTTKGLSEGKGLGLFISREIVSKCGGTLDYDASSPRTRFVMVLPRSKQHGSSP